LTEEKSQKIEEEVWSFPKIGSKKQRVWYTPDSVSHPAKMNTLLTRKLITTFTKAGDVVLDPMAGVGTTLVEGMLLGRNVVGVDIEEKFCKLIEGNLENVKKINERSRFKLRLGRAAVVKGDSRQLAQLIQDKMDAVVTSPPYASGGWKADEDPSKPIEREKRRKQLFPMRPPDPGRYSASKENIGNLPHGESVDTVLTSPPYSGSVSKHAGGDKVRERFGGFMGESQLEARKYSEDEANIGNLPDHGKVDVVVTSPPFASTNIAKEFKSEEDLEKFAKEQWVHKHGRSLEATKRFIKKSWQGYPKNAANIANLKQQGEVDAVITSPPFGEANRGSGIAKKGYSGKHGVDTKLHERHDRPLSDDPDNISNLPLGKVDTVLTSPPFARTKGGLTGERNILAKIRKGEKPKRDFGGIQAMPRPCSDDPKNIENLSYEKVDTVITSPPFSEGEHHYNHGLKVLGKNFKGRKAWEKKEHVELSPENVASLKHGQVDTVITSPPFANIAKSREGGISPHMQGLISQLSGIPVEEFAHDVKKLREAVKIAQSKIPFKYSDNPSNIGNLEMGKVDAVLTSPPYAQQVKGSEVDQQKEAKALVEKCKNYSATPGRLASHVRMRSGYSESPDNIGNLPPGNVDAVITSPPYANIHQVPSNSPEWTAYFQQMLKEKGYIEWQGKRYTEAEWRRMNHGRIDGRSPKGLKKDAHYSDNPENIGNLEHESDVDAIITSPPYEATFNVKQHTLSGIARRDPNFRREVGGYGQSEANIGNLRCGESVDAIVTSPPYEGSVNAPNDPERRAERMQRAGLDPKTIVGGKARCGEIDWKYSDSPENIGNEKGETYLQAMLKCYREMYKVLKPNGLCIVVLKNFIRNWKVVDLIGDTIKLCEHVGFRLVKRIRFMLPTESFWRTNYRLQFQKRFGKPLPSDFDSVYKFETVLVFEKT